MFYAQIDEIAGGRIGAVGPAAIHETCGRRCTIGASGTG